MKDYSILSDVKKRTRLPYGFVETDAWWFEQDWDYANKAMDLIKKEFEIAPHLSFYKPRLNIKLTKSLFFPFIYKDFSVKIISEQYHIN